MRVGIKLPENAETSVLGAVLGDVGNVDAQVKLEVEI